MIARLELKGIDGGLYKWWSMWFNAIIRAEPYQFLNIFNGEFLLFSLVQKSFLILDFTGVAWLSSARVVKCLVKSFNERNSFF